MENFKLKFMKKQKGITLIELVIAIAISSFIMASAYEMLNSGSIFFNRKISQSIVQNDIKVALKWLTKDLENTEPAEVLNGVEPIYSINNIKYYKSEQGKIGKNKIYKIIRESPDDGKFVLIEGIGEGADSFVITDSKENFYNVNMVIKDKWNKDVVTNFKINYRKKANIAEPKPEIKPDGNRNPENPFIDINNDGIMNGGDYNIIFDSKWVYDSKYDKRYSKGVLVFPTDFLVKDKVVTCIVNDGINVKSGVKLESSDNGVINLQSKDIVLKGATLDSNGKGNKSSDINISASGVINMSYASLDISGKGNSYGNINMNALGSIEGSYSKINIEANGTGKGNLTIIADGSSNYDYSEMNVLAVGNGEGNINITVGGSANYSYSKLSAEENGRASSKIILKAIGVIDNSFVSKQGNGYIGIGR